MASLSASPVVWPAGGARETSTQRGDGYEHALTHGGGSAAPRFGGRDPSHAHAHAHPHAHTCTSTCTPTCTHTCTHTCTPTCTHTCTHTCTPTTILTHIHTRAVVACGAASAARPARPTHGGWCQARRARWGGARGRWRRVTDLCGSPWREARGPNGPIPRGRRKRSAAAATRLAASRASLRSGGRRTLGGRCGQAAVCVRARARVFGGGGGGRGRRTRLVGWLGVEPRGPRPVGECIRSRRADPPHVHRQPRRREAPGGGAVGRQGVAVEGAHRRVELQRELQLRRPLGERVKPGDRRRHPAQPALHRRLEREGRERIRKRALAPVGPERDDGAIKSHGDCLAAGKPHGCGFGAALTGAVRRRRERQDLQRA